MLVKKVNMENVLRLGKKRNSSVELIQAIKILKFNKQNIWRKIGFIIIEFAMAISLALSSTTLIKVGTILEMLNGVLIAFFAVVFTGYALFQALIGDGLLLYLVNDTVKEEGEERSQLENSNDYFVKVMLIQFVVIILNAFCMMIMNVITDMKTICLFDSHIKDLISCIIIFVIFHFNFEAIWEIKSFIFNVFQLFNSHAMARIIEIMEKEEKKESK